MRIPPFDPIATRHSLLERLKDWSDQTSWQEFFDTYWRLIYNSAVKTGLADAEAKEVVQETLLAVAKKMPEFKADPASGSFRAWLMQLTRWRITDQFRKRAKAGTMGARATSVPSDRDADSQSTDTVHRLADPAGVELDAIWAEEWESNLMAAALERVKRQVSAAQYQMFDLHALQNLSVFETARALKVSVASVYMARSRVTRLVKKTVKEIRATLG